METRVIVADNARARIFTTHSVLTELKEIKDFVHPEARWLNQDFDADARGKSRDPHGSFDAATQSTEHEVQGFAKLLARHLKDMHNQQHFEQLVLIAPPKFLGLLRMELPSPLDKLVVNAIDKDLTRAALDEIIEYLKA